MSGARASNGYSADVVRRGIRHDTPGRAQQLDVRDDGLTGVALDFLAIVAGRGASWKVWHIAHQPSSLRS